LGTDGLVVLIVLPIREVMLGFIRLFVIVEELLVKEFQGLLFDWLFNPRLLLAGVEVLSDAFSSFRFELFGLMTLPMRDVMLGLIMLFVLLSAEVEELLTERLTVLLLLMLSLDVARDGEPVEPFRLD
jgi:hypothetical protein